MPRLCALLATEPYLRDHAALISSIHNGPRNSGYVARCLNKAARVRRLYQSDKKFSRLRDQLTTRRGRTP